MSEANASSALNFVTGQRLLLYSVFVAVLLAFGLYAAFVSAPAMLANAQR